MLELLGLRLLKVIEVELAFDLSLLRAELPKLIGPFIVGLGSGVLVKSCKFRAKLLTDWACLIGRIGIG